MREGNNPRDLHAYDNHESSPNGMAHGCLLPLVFLEGTRHYADRRATVRDSLWHVASDLSAKCGVAEIVGRFGFSAKRIRVWANESRHWALLRTHATACSSSSLSGFFLQLPVLLNRKILCGNVKELESWN